MEWGWGLAERWGWGGGSGFHARAEGLGGSVMSVKCTAGVLRGMLMYCWGFKMTGSGDFGSTQQAHIVDTFYATPCGRQRTGGVGGRGGGGGPNIK